MLLRLSVLVVCLFAVSVSSKHKRGNDPEFLKNVTNDQRSTFFQIANNPGISIQQKEDKLTQWAKVNNFSEQYAEFEKNVTVHKAELSKNVTAVIERLAAAKVEVDKIFADKTMTRTQQKDKVEELKKTYPQEVETLFYIGGLFEHHKGRKHEKPKNGSEEGKGGKRNKHH
ncbi:unnamed protein product [Caenorhabditis sp. 36 PRJEB53466]|nr:unnamed protein product [Caenorhabditis sp. 36 PRJEB53466]